MPPMDHVADLTCSKLHSMIAKEQVIVLIIYLLWYRDVPFVSSCLAAKDEKNPNHLPVSTLENVSSVKVLRGASERR